MGLSQAEFAQYLGVSVETLRVWDSGRRVTPPPVMARAAEISLATVLDATDLLPLADLARRIGVHVRTLRNAARDGRLQVAFDTKTTFRQPRRLATVEEGLRFRRTGFRQSVDAAVSVTNEFRWDHIPVDYHLRIRAARIALSLSQTELAKRIGAAGKAVVYQWEARKRTPSPIFWSRIDALLTGARG